MANHCSLIALMLMMTFHKQVHAMKIFGGHEVVPHSRPFMVIVRSHLENKTDLICGGFLIAEDFVMTAAHCYGSYYSVWLGVHDTAKINESTQIEVEQSFPNKDYNNVSFVNDVMLLKLSSKAVFNTNVRPILLATQDDKTLPKSCVVCGWGQTDENNEELSSKLMEVDITLISNANCEKENVYCSDGVKGPRAGDSGGPLVCEDTLAFGVVSAKFNSSGQLLYKYSKIPDHTKWIASITKIKDY